MDHQAQPRTETDLSSPLTRGGACFRNRIGVSPMCQCGAGEDGLPTDRHLAHLVSRAVAGPGMVMTEAAAIRPAHAGRKASRLPAWDSEPAVPGWEAVRAGAGVAVMAVGLITEAAQAQAILDTGQADMILLARAFLRTPCWVLNAAVAPGRSGSLSVPPQYGRGWGTPGRMAINRDVGAPMPALAG